VPNIPTASEAWFDQYLAAHGYQVTPEPDLGLRPPPDGLPKLPDRLIERDGIAAICEVKEFTTDALLRRWPDGAGRFGTFSSEEWLLNVRRQITSAARQLEPLSNDPRPLVIVLANPRRVVAEIAGPKLMEAMVGDLTIQIPLDVAPGSPAAEPQFMLGEGGRLAGERAPWVSAVVGLHQGDRRQDWLRARHELWKVEHWPDRQLTAAEIHAQFLAEQEALEVVLETEDVPEGEYFYVDVVEAVSDTAVGLPSGIFDGEHDCRWVVNREASTYVRTPGRLR
jgi:hypothetical protein